MTDRNVRLLLFGAGVSLLGDGMLVIAVGFAVFALGGGAIELGAIVGAGALTIACCILPAGALADRASRRLIAIGSDVLRAAAQVTAGVLVIAGAPSPWLLLPTTVLFGIGTALHQPATVGFVAEVVPEHRLVTVNGALQGLRGISLVLGAVLGAWLVEAFGPGCVLLADGATFLICSIAFACIRKPATASGSVERVSIRISDMLDAAGRLPWIVPGMLLITGFAFAMLGPMQVVGPSIAERSGGGAALWGAVSTAVAFGIVLGGGSCALGIVRAPLTATRILLVVGASGHLALAADAPLVATLPGYVALGAAMGVYAANWESAKQRYIPRSALSRISALDWFLTLFGMLGGVVLGSVVTSTVGPEAMLRVMACATLVLFAATFLPRSLRDVMSAPPPSV